METCSPCIQTTKTKNHVDSHLGISDRRVQNRCLETVVSNRLFRIFALAVVALLILAVVVTLDLAPRQPFALPSVVLHFVSPAVAYHPRGFSPQNADSRVNAQSIVRDLELLRESGFRSIVTYSSQGVLGSVPQLARHAGFDGVVIMGLWDPWSEEEWRKAVEQAANVDGFCLGNEGLGIRYEPNKLASRMNALRTLTGKPVTTSEPIDSYLNGPHRQWLLENSDWLFPIAHPFLAAEHDPGRGVTWISSRYDYLASNNTKIVILKEVGIPSAGSTHVNESSQVAFFKALEATGMFFFYFEAFDQPWKTAVPKGNTIEAHWGIFRKDGTPKELATWLKNHRARR